MNNYRKVETVTEPSPLPVSDFTITVQAGGKIKSYVDAALKHLQGPHQRVTLVGKSKAVNKTVTVAEIVKRRTLTQAPVTQTNRLYSELETDVWKPIVESLDVVKVTKHLPCLAIDLVQIGPETQ
eukprot:jgi/Hompol1/961/HPOL_001566-RA